MTEIPRPLKRWPFEYDRPSTIDETPKQTMLTIDETPERNHVRHLYRAYEGSEGLPLVLRTPDFQAET